MKIKTWHIIGTVFTVALGSLLHFAYEWSGFNPLFAVVGSVNESTWEHLKLLYWPYAAFALFELWIYGKNTTGFFTAKALGILAGMAFITAAFYTYTGVAGADFAWLDILLFVLGSAAAYYVSYAFIKCPSAFARRFDFMGFVILLALACMFCLFTFNPPPLGIFAESVFREN